MAKITNKNNKQDFYLKMFAFIFFLPHSAYINNVYINFQFSTFQFSIFNFQFVLGVPAPPSGFPLYLCSLIPLPVVEIVEKQVISTLQKMARKGCRYNP